MNTIRRLVDQLATRIRTQRAIEGFVTGGTASLLLVMLFLVLLKTTWIASSQMVIGSLLTLLIPVGLMLWGWTRPLDKVALAQKLDRAHDLHDRLSTALALDAKGERTPFVEAQIEDALRHLDVVRVAPAAPFKRPADLIPLALVVAVVGGLMFLPEFDHRGELPPPITITHDPVLDDATLALERDRLEALKRELEGVQDPEAEELVEEIEALLDAVENREITERQFLDELDRIEKEFFEKEEDSAEQVAEALKKAAEELEAEAGKELEKSPEMKELVDALKQKDMDAASDALGKLAEALSDKNMSEKDVERLAKLMEKFADKIDPTNPALKKLYEKNKEAFEKLAEKFGDKELSESEKQRLDRAKKNMDAAKKQKDAAEKEKAARRLKQLKRKYESFSEEAEKTVKGQGEKKANSDDEAVNDEKFANQAGRKAKDLQKEAQKDGQQQKADGAKAKAREQLDQLREAMKRSQGGKKGQGGQQGEQRGEKMREFLERAKGKPAHAEGGQKPQDGEKGPKAEKGDPGKMKGQAGKKGKPGAKEGQFGGENKKGTDQEASRETNFAGKGKGSRKLGEETDLEGKRRDEKVEGQLGDGASRSEIIKDASERGFATTQYKDVYVDYEDVVEEVMEKEKVPSGYRYYVKRYFQLIKPQE